MAEEATATQDEDVQWISEEEEAATGDPADEGETDGKADDKKDADAKTAKAGDKEDDKAADAVAEGDGEKEDKEDYKAKYTDLETRYGSLEKHKGDLDRAIHGLRQEIKKIRSEKKGADEVEFTDAQLLQILKENPGDENMQLQVMKQMTKQAGKKTEKSAAETAEIKQRQTAQTSWMQTNLPAEIMSDGSQFQTDIERTKEMLKLEDHPYADFMAAGVVAMMSMPAIVAAEKEKVSKAGIKEKVEDKRKEKIKDTKAKTGSESTGKQEKTERKPTTSEMEAIKNIFGSKATPAQVKKYLSMRGPAK